MVKSTRLVLSLTLLFLLFFPGAAFCLDNCCECCATVGCQNCELQSAKNDAILSDLNHPFVSELALAVNSSIFFIPENVFCQPVAEIVADHQTCDKRGHPAIGPPQT